MRSMAFDNNIRFNTTDSGAVVDTGGRRTAGGAPAEGPTFFGQMRNRLMLAVLGQVLAIIVHHVRGVCVALVSVHLQRRFAGNARPVFAKTPSSYY